MKKPPKIVWDLVRGVLGLAVAYYLIRKILQQNEVDLWGELGQARWWPLGLAVVVYGAVIAITAARWRILLAVQDVRLSFWQVYKLTMIGVAFSMVLPGAVGGDLVKMVYVRTHAKSRTAEAILSIMLDRVFGLLGLMVVAVMAMALTLDFLRALPLPLQLAAGFVGLASLGGLAAVAAAAWHERLERLPGVRHAIGLGAAKLPAKVTGLIRRLVDALDLYRTRRTVLAQALALSIAVHTLLTVCVAALSLALHEHEVPLRCQFVAVQTANAIAGIVPIPGGFGGRDYILAEMLKQGGAAAAKAGMIAPTLTLIIVFWSLVGGVFFLFTRAGGGRES